MTEALEALRFNLRGGELMKLLTEEEYEAIEMALDGDMKLYRLRPLMARFLVDEKDETIPHPQAMKIIGKIPMDQMGVVVLAFAKSIKDTAVPKENRDSSSPPSDQNVDASPVG